MKTKLDKFNNVVALGGGNGLGRVMSSLSILGSNLTGIVATTDNGGSTGRIRRAEGGIAWGDTRNCLYQLISKHNLISSMFEYRFTGKSELSGHNLGNLILRALEHLSIRPLEAIDIIRKAFKIKAFVIPMSEQPVDLIATDIEGNLIYGESAIDEMKKPPKVIALYPDVKATNEALEAISKADLILIGPGSFYTSLMPILLMKDITTVLCCSSAITIFINNLGKEISPAATNLTIANKLEMMENHIGKQIIDAIIVNLSTDVNNINRLIIRKKLETKKIKSLHNRQLLRIALEHTIRCTTANE
ncbi:MAG: uridine diphosphate-N-acetylglucosamine-binding protein YvcK [Pantoea sp. Brub]|nr:uridine diphosphate-N-acetylglucosamine-binding protein YvcK [Pantoea sp. Brub]